MPRLPTQTMRLILKTSKPHFPQISVRPFSLTASVQAEKSSVSKNDSTPGWSGRQTDDHAVKRDGHDVQSDSAHQGMKDHESLKKGSQAISRQDEGNNNKRAKKDRPAAPEPVIGMNEERGSKGH